MEISLQSGAEWNFNDASVDQGLLYQLFRYEIGNWSYTSQGKHVAWEGRLRYHHMAPTRKNRRGFPFSVVGSQPSTPILIHGK